MNRRNAPDADGDDRDTLERASSVTLYLFSLSSVSLALAAWEEFGYSVQVLAIWAVTLAAAQLAGERFAPHLQGVDEVKRGRLRLLVGILYLGIAVPGIVVALVNPDAQVNRTVVSVLTGLHPGLLVLVGVGRGPGVILLNNSVLAFFACLAGGLLASLAATAMVALLGCFLVFDHWFRTISAYRGGTGPWLALAIDDVVRSVLPIVVGLVLFLVVLPPVAALRYPVELRRVGQAEFDARATRLVVVLWVGGATLVYLLGRFLKRPRRESKAVLEVVEPIRENVERIPVAPERSPAASYRGARGQVVRAYLRFLTEAARAGLRREPSLTPSEFARVVREPARALTSLTETFIRARYGREEPSETDVAVAERESDALVIALRSRQDRGSNRDPASRGPRKRADQGGA